MEGSAIRDCSQPSIPYIDATHLRKVARRVRAPKATRRTLGFKVRGPSTRQQGTRRHRLTFNTWRAQSQGHQLSDGRHQDDEQEEFIVARL